MNKKIFVVSFLVSMNALLCAEKVEIQLANTVDDNIVFQIFKARGVLNLEGIDSRKSNVTVVYDPSKTTEEKLLADIKKETRMNVSKLASKPSDTEWMKPAQMKPVQPNVGDSVPKEAELVDKKPVENNPVDEDANK